MASFITEQEPIYISVREFRSLTKMSMKTIAEITDIPERTLYRYQQIQQKGNHYKQIKRHLALIYKSMHLENCSQEESITDKA